ncbi:Acyl-CoA N-acyltransferase [Cordyceps fumosorosea ARSEF 2679]|uniref:Acyl-CoA N-acyltransferase n=1 Tax=Cordyceps fumosorosea (strain ARSEF 2679) TaxID=1081104 RepID=A0A167V6S3_CORFA|nr:Acyl-CoA N-acyltransferase [Cordyceps fumosorosea ARSEF 2679]OAA62288.1 Acyl-CoA N-acyltransferase [Cordyceps fumosorosea ARSEF 2679]
MPRPTKALECPLPPSGAPGAILVETPRLVLRRFKPDDAPALARAANHRAVWDGVRDSFPHPYTLADAEAFVATPCPDADPVKRLYPTKVAVCVKGSAGDDDEQQLVGCIGADPGQDVLYRTWELGYWLTPDAWGRGYASEAVGALLHWLLRTWPGSRRVQALTLAGNKRSAKVLARCGFVLEGVQRDAVEKAGVVQDLHVHAVLRRDVPVAG